MKQWLEFNRLDAPERKTYIYEVRNKETDFFLGTIEWHGAWRQYVLSPTGESHILAKGCMKEIVDFITKLMEERK